MIVLTKTFIPYQQFDLDITAAIYNLNLADLNHSIYLPQESYQAVLGVLMFVSVGSTNMV